MKWLDKILDNKWAVIIFFLMVLLIVIYFMFVRKSRGNKDQRTFTVADIPAEGAKEGNAQVIFEKSKTLADALYFDMSGPNITHRAQLYEELANASDVYFKAVWNQYGIRDEYNLYEWLQDEFTVFTVVPLLDGFAGYRNTIMDRIDYLKLN